MMYPYPFFRGYGFRRPYHYYPPTMPSHNVARDSSKNDEKPCFPNVSFKNKYENFDNSSNDVEDRNFKVNNIENIDDDSEGCFEIFGLKLHFDDLLIIALLFFLYQEEVKDTYLYIALILLLLS